MKPEASHVSPLTEQIRAMVDRDEVALPPFPDMGRKVLDLLQDLERVDSHQLAELLNRDPAIAADLLRTANSAMFCGLRPVTDVSQAITRLGIGQVSNIVTTLVMKGQFQSSDPRIAGLLGRMWSHAVGTAIAARRLTEVTGGDPAESYLAGLLHDVGKLVVLKAADAMAEDGNDVIANDTVLDELLAVLHADLGRRVLEEWNLPASIAQVAAMHHSVAPDPEDTLTLRVRAANAITHQMDGQNEDGPLEGDPDVERLHLSEIELAALLVDLEDEIDGIRRLF